MAILGTGNDNINIDGADPSFVDFGGADTYTLLSNLSADVTITDVDGGTINLPAGLDITAASFLADGVQFTINGNTVTIIGDPSLMTFVFGGTPLDTSAGTALSFADTAVAFGTTLPAAGDPANDAVNTGEINDDGTVGDSGLTPEEIYAEAIAEAEAALADAIDAQAAADAAEAAVVDLATAEAYKAAADAAKAAADAAKAAADAAAAAAANTDGTDDDAEAAIVVAEADAAVATADAEVASADQAIVDNTPNPGQNFILTTAQDIIPGMIGSEGTADNSGDDTVFGIINGPDATFTLGDNLNTGGGSDLLNLTVGDDNNDITLFTTVLSELENVKLDITSQSLNDIDINDPLNEIDGVTLDFLNDDDRDDDIEVVNVNPNAHLGVQNLLDGDDYDVTFFLNETTDPINGSILLSNYDDLGVFVEPDDSGDGSSSSDVFSVEIHNVMNTNGYSQFYIGDIEELNVHVTGDSELENFGNYYNNDGSDGPNPNIVNLTLDADLDVGFWDFSDDVVPAAFNISGSGDLFIEDLDDGESDLVVDSTAATGNVNIADASNDFESFAAMFGIGNDRLIMEDGFDFDTTTADGGDGVDIFGGSLDDIQAASMDPDFADNITNFEIVEIDERVLDGETYDIMMPTFNGIDHVISAGTDGGVGAINERQDIDADSTGDDGFAIYTFDGNSVTVPVPAGLSEAATASAIATSLNGVLNQLPGIVNVFNVVDDVRFVFDSALGDVPLGALTVSDPADLVTITNQVTNPGTNQEAEVFTLPINNAAGVNDSLIILDNVDPTQLSGAQEFTVDGGSSIDEIGQKIADEVNANVNNLYTAVYDVDTNTVTMTAKLPGVQTDAFVSADGGVTNPGVVNVTNPGVDAVIEDHSFILRINGGDNTSGNVFTEDGFLEYGNFTLNVPAGTTVDQLGALIVSNKASFIAQNPDIADIDYNTVSGRLSIEFIPAAGNVAANEFSALFEGNANTGQNDGFGDSSGLHAVTDGFAGTPGGVLILTDIASGGTFELSGDHDGLVDVIVEDAAATPDDVFNVFLNGDDALTNNGPIVVSHVETVNVLTGTTDGDPTGQALLNLIAEEAGTLTVAGNHGVDLFGSSLVSLTMFDGSGVTAEGGTGSIGIDDFADDADVTAIGGNGDDVIDASIVGTGTMDDVGATIDGGAGEDFIIGSMGADILNGGDDGDQILSSGGGDTITLGAGEDAYVMVDQTDSTIALFDIITDFVLGEDLLDFSALGVVSFNGVEVNVFNNAADASTDLANNDLDGAFNVALDSSTGNVYADFDDDGIANSVIQLTGVTTLDDTAIFV